MTTSRTTRAFVTAIATCLLLALVGEPIFEAAWPDYAVWKGCPVSTKDLSAFQSLRGDDPQRGELAVVALDPWGERYRFRKEDIYFWVYSSGPDREDGGGPGRGDDLQVRPEPIFRAIQWSPLWWSAAALCLGWLWATVRILRKARSERLEVEAARAAFLSLLPGALGGWLALSHGPEALASLEGLKTFVLVPLPVGAACGLALVAFLFAFWLRLRRPLDAHLSPALSSWRRSRVLAVVLGLLALCAGGSYLAAERYTAWQRIRLLAGAQLGFPSDIEEVLAGPDLKLLAEFVNDLAPELQLNRLSDDSLRGVARLGSGAIPILVSALRAPEPILSHRPVPLSLLEALDPEWEALRAAVESSPQDFQHVLAAKGKTFLPSWGRQRLLRLLVSLLQDERWVGNYAINGVRLRVCDLAAGQISELVGDPNLKIPAVWSNATHQDRDAALGRIRAWWKGAEARPRLAPRRWFELRLSELPASEQAPLRLQVEVPGGSTTVTTILEPSAVVEGSLGSEAGTIRVLIKGGVLCLVSFGPQGGADCTLRIRLKGGVNPGELGRELVLHPAGD